MWKKPYDIGDKSGLHQNWSISTGDICNMSFFCKLVFERGANASTELPLLRVHIDLLDATEANRASHLVLPDLSEEYDMVVYELLLQSKLGIR